MPSINEAGVVKDIRITDNMDCVEGLVSEFLKQRQDLTIWELMILQRHYIMAITGVFCDIILRRQVERKKKMDEFKRRHR